MKCIVSGSLIVDRVMPHGQQKTPRVALGGGAAYALTAAKLWLDDCILAAYTGQDFDSYYGPWMDANQFSTQGIQRKFPRTNCSDLYYLENGTHAMGPGDPNYSMGGDLPDMELLEPFFPEDCSNTILHLVSGNLTKLLPQLQTYRKKGLKVGYEMDPEDAFSDPDAYIRQVTSEYVDFFSLSYEEIRQLYPAVQSLGDAISLMQQLKCPVFLRAGEQGAYMIQAEKICHTPMIGVFGCEDPTGCGNTSTMAAFIALCQGRSLKEISVIGGVTASANAGCKGLIPKITPQLRSKCASLVEEYLLK